MKPRKNIQVDFQVFSTPTSYTKRKKTMPKLENRDSLEQDERQDDSPDPDYSDRPNFSNAEGRPHAKSHAACAESHANSYTDSHANSHEDSPAGSKADSSDDSHIGSLTASEPDLNADTDEKFQSSIRNKTRLIGHEETLKPLAKFQDVPNPMSIPAVPAVSPPILKPIFAKKPMEKKSEIPQKKTVEFQAQSSPAQKRPYQLVQKGPVGNGNPEEIAKKLVAQTKLNILLEELLIVSKPVRKILTTYTGLTCKYSDAKNSGPNSLMQLHSVLSNDNLITSPPPLMLELKLNDEISKHLTSQYLSNPKDPTQTGEYALFIKDKDLALSKMSSSQFYHAKDPYLSCHFLSVA
ncbi:hypothetical protein BDR26DRAFT_939410 [Obelidium mucronatum]|nr:hypothetical protein BDR26DRAFT_939410 [Obelidium mucronatum]